MTALRFFTLTLADMDRGQSSASCGAHRIRRGRRNIWPASPLRWRGWRKHSNPPQRERTSGGKFNHMTTDIAEPAAKPGIDEGAVHAFLKQCGEQFRVEHPDIPLWSIEVTSSPLAKGKPVSAIAWQGMEIIRGLGGTVEEALSALVTEWGHGRASLLRKAARLRAEADKLEASIT